MNLRFLAVVLGGVLLALPLSLLAGKEPDKQQAFENFMDCYAVVDAEYFTNRDMKRGAQLNRAIEALWSRNAQQLKGRGGFEERRRVIKTELTAQERARLSSLCLPAIAAGNFSFVNPFNARISTPRYRELIGADLEQDRKAMEQRRAEEAARQERAARQQAQAPAQPRDPEPDPAELARMKDCDDSAAQTLRSADRDMQEANRMVGNWLATQRAGTNYGWEPLRRGCSTLQSGYRTLGNKQCPARFQNMVQSYYDRYYINLPTGTAMTCEG